MASLAGMGMVAIAAMAGHEIHVEVADERRFQNTMADAVPLDCPDQGPSAMALALPAPESFLEAGLALARKVRRARESTQEIGQGSGAG